jgi:CBS domain-containing protein
VSEAAVSEAAVSRAAVSPVDLDAPVDTVARPATTLAESAPLPQAWERLHHDRDHLGVVVRDGMALAVLTAGALAERWPAGGPLVQRRWTVRDVLDRPCGVEVLAAGDSLRHAGHRLLATGLPALPVRARHGPVLGVVTTTGLLAALLGGPRQ